MVKRVPANQHDVWIWINGSTPDVTFEHARAAWLAVRDVATLAADQPAFVHRDSRDLTGFIDGTANPEPLDAPDVALIPPGLPGECGSYVIAIRWVHNTRRVPRASSHGAGAESSVVPKGIALN